MKELAGYHELYTAVFFVLWVRSGPRLVLQRVLSGSVRCAVCWRCSQTLLCVSALRSAPFLRRCIRRPLLVHSTSCERPVRLAGGQPKRGEATPPGRQKIFPSVSGSFPSGRRADIGWKVEQLVRDDQWTSIHAGRAEEALATKKEIKRCAAWGSLPALCLHSVMPEERNY